MRRGAGKGLHVNGPAVAECSISVAKKASITSGKLVAEAWLGNRYELGHCWFESQPRERRAK